MKVSKRFLNDYVDIEKIDFKEIAERLVFLGNEYDSITKLSSATNLVIGKILKVEKHPNADTLNICEVDTKEEILTIVCGASNVAKNKKVIVAKVGAILPKITIKKATIRGIESNGMICGLDEIGIDSKFLTEKDLNGIHILNNEAPIGEDVLKYLGFDDEVIDLDLTPDRADLLSVIGLAYEISSIYDLEVKMPNNKVNEIDKDINDEYKVMVDTLNCPFYSIKLVENVQIGESPKFIKNRLMASGIRSINNVVDISNYVMLETGQPLHFFDADKMAKQVQVRMAKTGEELITLDGKKRDLKETDIVITDGFKIVALGGVMGGLDTEVTNETKNILIESAIFNPKNIRNTSKRVLRSEASNRFEKGVSFDRSVFALNRACYLLNKYANGDVLSNSVIYDKVDKKIKRIKISLEKINSILGINLNKEDVINVFKKLKLEVKENNNQFIVIIPPRRMDLNILEDLIEEVGRIIGYDKIKSSLPKLLIKEGSYSNKIKYTNKLKERLFGLGLNEVITYSLVGEKELKFTTKTNLIKLMDPLSIEHSIMRPNLIPSLLNVYNYNKARNINNINIFEIGSVYSKEEYKETLILGGLLSGVYLESLWQKKKLEVDFYLVKGIIENILEFLGFENRFYFISNESLIDMHPYRNSLIKVDLDEVGFFGQVHPTICNEPIYVFELNLEKLFKKKTGLNKFKEINIYPFIKKDLAFIVDKDIESFDIQKVIKKVGGRLLVNIDVFDVHESEAIGENKKSIAYSLKFQDSNRTLTEDEVHVIFNKIIKKVELETKAILRDK